MEAILLKIFDSVGVLTSVLIIVIIVAIFLTHKLTKFTTALGQQIEEQSVKLAVMNEMFEKIEERFQKQDNYIDERFDQQDEEIEDIKREVGDIKIQVAQMTTTLDFIRQSIKSREIREITED